MLACGLKQRGRRPSWVERMDFENWLATASTSRAFKCGLRNIAEDFLTQARDKCENWERSEEMALLAEIWCARGQHPDAKGLLVECLSRLLAESETATGSDKRLFEKWFQTQRAALLRLFPRDGEGVLAESEIPNTTLK